MQISLTKKLADATALPLVPTDETANPLFAWTATWTNTFNRHKEDMIVMVNNATYFTVSIFGVKRNQFKNIAEKMVSAIRHTFQAMNLNEEVIDAYLQQAAAVTFCANHDRKLTAQVNRQGLSAALYIRKIVNESNGKIKFEDTLGHILSNRFVNYTKKDADTFYPRKKMLQALAELTDKPLYRYRAFELLVTLDLDIYKAVRRLIVPADLEFSQLHQVLQTVFKWENYHLYDFAVFGAKKREPIARLVADAEALEYDDSATLLAGHKLSEYLPKNKLIVYTYDMGDNWEHEIQLVREIAEHDAESSYLLEAIGQTPPEDVGGIPGFIAFRAIICDTNHPEYAETRKWAGFWMPELDVYERRPRPVFY